MLEDKLEDKLEALEAERYQMAGKLYIKHLIKLTKSQMALGTLKRNNNDPGFTWCLLSKETDRSIWAHRGNNKNSDLIMGEDGEIVGFVLDGRAYM